MTYATLLQSEVPIKSNYLAILQPRFRLIDWTLFSGFVYSVPFNLGRIVSISENGTTLTEHTSTSLNAGYWYHDEANETIYLRTLQSANPTTVQIVITYSIYVATIDGYFYANLVTNA